MRVAKDIVLTGEERAILVKWSRGRSTSIRLAHLAMIVLEAADGRQDKDIAIDLGCTRRTSTRRFRTG